MHVTNDLRRTSRNKTNVENVSVVELQHKKRYVVDFF